MTIEKEQLIQLLMDRTGLEREEVEKQLAELVKRIDQAASQGKNFEIKDFGTFRMSDGTLHFEPSDRLETEINKKYAGMRPIELIGAFKEIPPSEESTKKPVPSTENNDDTSKEEETSEDVFEVEEQPGTEPSPEKNDKSAEKPEKRPEPFTQAEKKSASFVFDQGGENENPLEEDSDLHEHTTRVNNDETEEESEDLIGTILTVCVVVIAICVLLWFVYDAGLFGGTSQGAPPGKKATVTQTPSSGNQMQHQANVKEPDTTKTTSFSTVRENENDSNTTGREQNRQTTVPTSGQLDEKESGPVYGLMGNTADKSYGGYTIVVHSVKGESHANGVLEKLKSRGYRTILSNAVVNGITYWRIGVGQFKTISEAQKVAGTLPEPFKSHHFIKRIQK